MQHYVTFNVSMNVNVYLNVFNVSSIPQHLITDNFRFLNNLREKFMQFFV